MTTSSYEKPVMYLMPLWVVLLLFFGSLITAVTGFDVMSLILDDRVLSIMGITAVGGIPLAIIKRAQAARAKGAVTIEDIDLIVQKIVDILAKDKKT